VDAGRVSLYEAPGRRFQFRRVSGRRYALLEPKPGSRVWVMDGTGSSKNPVPSDLPYRFPYSEW
jgi:hypothetical protein